MDNKDGRRSRVPAGTFGGSVPPPGRAQAVPPPPPPERPQQVKTLTGEEPAPLPDVAEPFEIDADVAAVAEARKRHISTLVGVPAIAARSGAPPSNAPVLAPPPWRGAQPYLEGQEPQLRVSSIPAPRHVPAVPSAAAEPSRSRVTTKMAAVPPAPVHQAPDVERAASPALGDTIQEMLDAQASVPMQVDEPQADARSSEETPIDELAIDDILDSLSEPPPPIESAEAARKRQDEPTIVHAAPPPADGPRLSPEPALATPLQPLSVDDDDDDELPLDVSVEPEVLQPQAKPAVKPEAPPAHARAAPPPPPAAARERKRRPVAASSGTAPALRGGAATALPVSGADAVTSLAPAEVTRRPRYRDDAQAGLGIVLVAAMGVIGVGGWFLTRGGYPGVSAAGPAPKPSAVVAPPAAAVDSPASAKAPLEAPAPAAEEPNASGASAAARNAKKPVRALPTGGTAPALRGGASLRPGAKLDDSAAPALAPDLNEDQVLKVTPHQDRPSEMTDIPSRDDVLAALAPIRAAVNECARGQRGVAQLDITVANTGFVTHAVVGGDFAGTPEGSCIARVARSAQFVPFKKPRFRVIYPFSL